MLLIMFMPFLVFLIIYFFFIRFSSGYGDAFLYSFSVISGIIYLAANILSAFRMYNRKGLFIFWLCLLIFGLSAHGYAGKNKMDFKKPVLPGDGYIRLIYGIAGAVLVLCVIRASVYPPENNDSVVYHLVRAFYYFKQSEVSNIPSAYIMMNYSGPANAILLSHLFILTGGKEYFINLIQFPSMVAIGVGVRNICRELGASERSSTLSGGVAMMLPLVILQAATTQNDLLAAGYVVCAVYFMIKTFRKKNVLDMICLGLCGGAAALSKIASLSVVLPFLVLYLIYGILRDRLPALKKYFFSAVAVFSVTFSFWIRNAMDLRGDFLALGPSLYMNREVKYHLVDYIGKILIYLAYCCCGYIGKINHYILDAGRNLYHLIGAEEYGIWDPYYQVVLPPIHDYFPYGLSFCIALLCMAVVLISKRFRKVYKLYTVLALLSLFIGGVIMPGTDFIQSVTRYMMGNIIICVPCIAFVVDALHSQGGFSGIFKKILMVGSIAVMSLNGVLCNFYDYTSPLKDFWKTTYEEKRDFLTPRSLSWSLISSDVKELIDAYGGKKIGICEVKLTHIYSMLHELTDRQYDVRSIYGEYGMSYLDESFVPDVIVWVNDYGKYEDLLTYQGEQYRTVYVTGAVLTLNGCQAVLYKKDSGERSDSCTGYE